MHRIVILFVTIVFLSSCSEVSELSGTQKGVLGGTAVGAGLGAVSYTHLTLPTICSV